MGESNAAVRASWSAPDPTQVFHSPSTASLTGSRHSDPSGETILYQNLSSELRALLFATALSACPTRATTPDQAANVSLSRSQASVGRAHGQLDVRNIGLPVMDSARYLRNWVTECACWLDMFDQSRAFGAQVPCLAQSSPAILYAMLALSARQSAQQRVAQHASEHSFELYSKAVASLSAALDARDPCIPVAACILCVFEMMSANPRDWRHHLEGCAALFEAFGIHGLSGGLQQAVFWCFARMDLCSAIIDGGVTSTVMPIEKWVIVDEQLTDNADELLVHDVDSDQYVSNIRDAFVQTADHNHDMLANFAVYLCAKACDLLARRTRFSELGEDNGCDIDRFSRKWDRLWKELQLWESNLPSDFLPLTTVIDKQGFPRKLFTQYAAISGNQLYHTACILMLEAREPRTTGGAARGKGSALWHAKQVVGISLANEHRGCLNNAIQPLYIAGKLFTHRDEHFTVIKLLRKIEAESGWAAIWRIRDLETIWGYL